MNNWRVWVGLSTLFILNSSCGDDTSSTSVPPATEQDAGTDSAVDDANIPGDGSDAASDAPGEDAGPKSLEVGEVLDIAVDDDGALRAELLTPTGEESFIAVLFDDTWQLKTEHSYELEVTPQQATTLSARTREAKALLATQPPRMPMGEPIPQLPGTLNVAPPMVGEIRSFEVMDATWSKKLVIDAECVRVGGALAVWLDRTTMLPAPADIDASHLEPIVAGFQETVLPRHRKFFGQESDVDEDGLIHILYTPIFAGTGTVAYVSQCDLVKMNGCPVSNGMELVYATPPAQIGSPVMASVSSVLEVLAHEVQHSIYFYRKFMLNQMTGKNENPYIHEAMSGLAEDLSGYGNGTFFVWANALDHMDQVSGPDLLDSSLMSYDSARDAALRGAGYLLYRYAFEQAGGNEFVAGNEVVDKGGVVFLNSLVDSSDVGQLNLEKRADSPVSEVLFDWYTTMAVSNRKRDDGNPLSSDARFNYAPVTFDPDTLSSTGKPERHGVDLFESHPMTGPLSGPVIVSASAADGKIRSGGVEYLRLGAGPGADLATLVVRPGDGSVLRMRVVRER